MLTSSFSRAPSLILGSILEAAASCRRTGKELARPGRPQQQLLGCSTWLRPAARACGVGLSAVQLTGRPLAAIARVVLGPMATNCEEARHKRHGLSTPARAVCGASSGHTFR